MVETQPKDEWQQKRGIREGGTAFEAIPDSVAGCSAVAQQNCGEMGVSWLREASGAPRTILDGGYTVVISTSIPGRLAHDSTRSLGWGDPYGAPVTSVVKCSLPSVGDSCGVRCTVCGVRAANVPVALGVGGEMRCAV